MSYAAHVTVFAHENRELELKTTCKSSVKQAIGLRAWLRQVELNKMYCVQNTVEKFIVRSFQTGKQDKRAGQANGHNRQAENRMTGY